jgi:imidazoleglycerol-phosphate dehydratase
MGIFKKTGERQRKISYERKSKETQIEVPELNVDGTGKTDITTPIGFLTHMLTLFCYHGYFDLRLTATGDIHVDKHHLNEDIGIALGEAFKKALGDCKGITRMASAEVPMDMASAKALVDLSNRESFSFSERTSTGFPVGEDKEGYSVELAKDLLESFAKNLRMNLHIEISGEGDVHHYLEAAFKALGVALDKATRVDPRRGEEVPSSKGIL